MMERRQPTIVELIMIALVAGAVGIAAGYWTRKSLAEAKIASAEEAARKILDEGETQAQNYLEFLKSGKSNYPIELLKVAGIDMSQKEPVELAMETFKALVEEFDNLY